MADAKDKASHLGLLLVDISNLSRVNHWHGYEAGDRMLRLAFDALLELSKLPHSIFRVGSHRFAFILRDLGNPGYIALALNRVQAVLGGELHGDGNTIGADIKIGVAISRAGECDAMATLVQAEASLAHVKLGGQLRLEEILEPEPDTRVDPLLEQRFAQALQDNAFELFYQPKVELRTGQVHSAEALLRWLPEGRDPVAPEVLVELAESTGRSYDLAKWVIHHGVRQIRDWQGKLDIGLALNVHAALVGSSDLPELVHDAVAIWGIDPARLTLEITESAFIEDKRLGFDNLLRLRQEKVNISIDDFGTGYSSLSYFKHIPAVELKIDRSFVESMFQDPQDLELVKIMIHLAHQFGLSVVAEGVCDRATLDTLRELGCDYAQGYYLSAPHPRRDFEHWLRNWGGLSDLQ